MKTMMQWMMTLCAGLAIVLMGSGAAVAAEGKLLVDDFEGRDQMRNQLGNRASVYIKAPSRIKLSYSPQQQGGTQTTALMLGYDKKANTEGAGSGGWCGYYTVLKGFKGGEDVYVDASGKQAITLWVKGQQGGETFAVGLADRTWDQREDSQKAGAIGQYLPAGEVTTEWQQATISLDEFFVDNAQLATISINFEADLMPEGGVGTVYIDEIAIE